MLIYLNFNSVEYINYLIAFITKSVEALNSLEEKAAHLYFLYKSFKQLYKKPDVAFNPDLHSIDIILNNWFIQELAYMEKIRVGDDAAPVSNKKSSKQNQVQSPKINFSLSTDQLGLILRAAHEKEIIVARSLNSVFKSIVPHLSTTSQENLSYDSMRSKSYAAELRDRDVVIKTLQEIIASVKEF